MHAMAPDTPINVELPLPYERALLDEARRICRARLMANPGLAREWRLLGALAGRDGRDAFAVACLLKASNLVPGDAGILNELASALRRVGRHAEALTICLRSLSLEPARSASLRALAESLHAQRELVAATAIYDEYLRVRPDDSEALAASADVAAARGCADVAIQRYEASLRIEVSARRRASVHARLGAIHQQRGEADRALSAFRAGLRESEDVADLPLGIGRVLMSRGAFAEAVSAFRDALDADATNVDAATQLVCALELQGRSKDAARAWLHLGTTLTIRDAHEEAIPAFQQAASRTPDGFEARLRLGDAEIAVGRPAQALAPTRAALAVTPSHIGGHAQLGRALQLTGDWDAGWDELGWLSDERTIRAWRAFEQPRWDGASLEGRAILCFAGQDYGLGDTLQFVRFARHLKRRGASRVIVECPSCLVSLISRMDGADVAPRGVPLPAFDVMAPMLWVPSIDPAARRLSEQDVSYLSADSRLVTHWQARLGPARQPRVGLCWSGESTRGDAHRRFTTLETFAPLARVHGLRLVSLQIGRPADELLCPPDGMAIESVLSDSHGVESTAAILMNLDLVITVDTMVAHLAGALGRPVWTVLPFAADWRWLQGDVTPWYPSMRLFRQSTPHGWSGVVEQVEAALGMWAALRPQATIGMPSHEGV